MVDQFCSVLKFIRINENLTIEKYAEKLDMSITHLNELEHGYKRSLSSTTILKIINLYHMTFSEFIHCQSAPSLHRTKLEKLLNSDRFTSRDKLYFLEVIRSIKKRADTDE